MIGREHSSDRIVRTRNCNEADPHRRGPLVWMRQRIRLAASFDHLRVLLAIRKSTISTVSVEKIGLGPIARTRKSWRLRLRKKHRNSTANKTHTIVFATQSAFIAFYFFAERHTLCGTESLSGMRTGKRSTPQIDQINTVSGVKGALCRAKRRRHDQPVSCPPKQSQPLAASSIVAPK